MVDSVNVFLVWPVQASEKHISLNQTEEVDEEKSAIHWRLSLKLSLKLSQNSEQLETNRLELSRAHR